jgi:hypothetical protein
VLERVIMEAKARVKVENDILEYLWMELHKRRNNQK